MVQCGARARSSVLLEFFLMVRRKVSGNSRTLGFLREAQNSGVKHPRSQEFENGAMRNSGEIVGSSGMLGVVASRILLNGPPQGFREQPHAWVYARSAKFRSQVSEKSRIQEWSNAELGRDPRFFLNSWLLGFSNSS